MSNSHNNNTKIHETVLCDTSHLGIIKIDGEDASAFLQGQFSNDVALVDESTTQLNSYNSPKGRMYASFRLCKIEDAYYLILPNELMEMISKRLRMFIMRSKVTLNDVSDSWSSFGLSGSDLDKCINNLPNRMDEISSIDDVYFIQVPGVERRYLCIGENEKINSAKTQLAKQLTHADSHHWQRLDIHAGLANIYSTTQEEFVAQMVNLQLVNGVSFTKGCYPGQEVVARMHYLGKLKKRMYRISIDTAELPGNGSNIYESGTENQQSVGQIVDAQINDKGGLDALAVLQIASAENQQLQLNSVDGPSIQVESLPYSYEN